MHNHDVLFRNILRFMHSGVITVDMQGQITNFNPASEKILGVSSQDAVGHSFAECFFEDENNDAFTQTFLDAVYHADFPHSRDVTFYRGGKPRHLSLTTSFIWSDDSEQAEKIGVIAIFADITQRKIAEDQLRISNAELEQRVKERTQNLEDANKDLKREVEQRRQAEDKLKHMSQHDALTGLPNRVLFEERLNLSIARVRSGKDDGMTLLYFDLDGFKQVNDVLGHNVGDWLLQQVSRRVEACLREVDIVARMGGDEFTAILEGNLQEQELTEILQRMQTSIKKPFVTDEGEEANVGLSIGVSRCPSDGEDAETLVRCADEAMYAAKRAGKGQWKIYAELPKRVNA